MRNRYLDFLRFLAIIRVVVYHATGWAFLTLVFPAMSVMFALAGSLMARTIDRVGIWSVGRRLRRLLPSLWVMAALLVPAMLLTGLAVEWRLLYWLLPLGNPPSNSWGALALSQVWYLRDYVWFVLVSPVVLPVFRRAPLPTLLAPYALLLALEFGPWTSNEVVRDFGLYFGAWLLGFAHHDGLLQRIPRRLLVGIAATAAVLGGAWIVTHPGPRGFDINDIRLGNALWSLAFVLILLGMAPLRAAWVDRNRLLSRAVTALNQRALTIYLWHMPLVLLVLTVTAPFGLYRETWRGLAVQLILLALLLAVAVALFGWVEDLAAGRRLAVIPGRPSAPAAARIPAQRTPVDAPRGESADTPHGESADAPRGGSADASGINAPAR